MEIWAQWGGENVICNLIGISLNLKIALCSIVMLTILILPIHEHGVSFHLCFFLHQHLIIIRVQVFIPLGRFVLCCAKSLQSCLTLCDRMDCSPPGSSVLVILQTKILEWIAMPSSRGSSQPRDQSCISYVSCIGRQVFFY